MRVDPDPEYEQKTVDEELRMHEEAHNGPNIDDRSLEDSRWRQRDVMYDKMTDLSLEGSSGRNSRTSLFRDGRKAGGSRTSSFPPPVRMSKAANKDRTETKTNYDETEGDPPASDCDTFLSWVLMEADPMAALQCVNPKSFAACLEEFKQRFCDELVTDERVLIRFCGSSEHANNSSIKERARAACSAKEALLNALGRQDFDVHLHDAVPFHAANVLEKRIVVYDRDEMREYGIEHALNGTLVLSVQFANGKPRFFRRAVK